MRQKSAWLVSLVLALTACAPPPVEKAAGPNPAAPQPAAHKQLVAAINSEPAALSSNLTLTLSGTTEIEALTHGGLAITDNESVPRLQLGEAIPSLENGLWKVSSDGRMETTFRIKPNVFWHDGTPLSADDLAFTLAVSRDKEIPFLSSDAFAGIEGTETLDPRTITVKWKQPFIRADTLFSLIGSSSLALPLPKHLLEQPFLTDKVNFIQLPYWSEQFVGAGPYRVREFARSSHVTLEAFDQFALGRPKIDEIEIRFIANVTTLIANILAGTVDVMLGRGLSYEQGQSISQQWREGRVDFSLINVVLIYPQFINSSPAVIGGDARFRRALVLALDRQEMVNTLLGGISPIAQSRVSMSDPDYPDIESGIVTYPYDPRRATELIDSLGFTKGPDGRYLDGNKPLGFELRAGGGTDTQTKPMLAAADYWQKIGLTVETAVVPEQRLRDLEYRATYTGFELVQQPSKLDSISTLKSESVPLPQNNYQTSASKNYARYSTPEMDALISKYFVTIARPERMELARQVIHRVTDEVIWISLYYVPQSNSFSNRLLNAKGIKGTDALSAWNTTEWDLRE